MIRSSNIFCSGRFWDWPQDVQAGSYRIRAANNIVNCHHGWRGSHIEASHAYEASINWRGLRSSSQDMVSIVRPALPSPVSTYCPLTLNKKQYGFILCIKAFEISELEHYTSFCFFSFGPDSLIEILSNERISGKPAASLYRPVGQLSKWDIRISNLWVGRCPAWRENNRVRGFGLRSILLVEYHIAIGDPLVGSAWWWHTRHASNSPVTFKRPNNWHWCPCRILLRGMCIVRHFNLAARPPIPNSDSNLAFF